MTILANIFSCTREPQPISLDGVRTMTKNRELILGIQHIRINCFSIRLQCLKALIKIYGLIEELKGKLRK